MSRAELNTTIDLLDENQQDFLLQFAKFLLSSTKEKTNEDDVKKTKREISPPDNESVIKSLRRLRESYYMLNADKLMNITVEQMTAHLVKGQDKKTTITNLEKIFSDAYQNYLKK